MKKILFPLIFIGTTLFGGLEKSISNENNPKSFILPGTCAFDIDSHSFSENKLLKRIYDSLLQTIPKESHDDYKVSYNSQFRDVDIFWRQKNERERQLVPMNGSTFAYFGKKVLDDITKEDVLNAKYSQEAISGDNDDNRLEEGTIIGVKTNKNKYFLLQIKGYIPLNTGDSKNESYHMKCNVKPIE